MTEECRHESEMHITMGHGVLIKDFICKKCGAKKICIEYTLPLAYTGHGYIPRRKHWWQL